MIGRAVLGLLAAVSVAGVASTPASAYEALPAEVGEALDACDVRPQVRTSPSPTGVFYGALLSDPASRGDEVYSRGIGVVVGIGDYEDGTGFRDLPGVERDVDRVSSFLMAEDGLAFDAVVVLRDGDVDRERIYCVAEALALLGNGGKSSDRLVFYWAGHGKDRNIGGRTVGFLPFSGTPAGRIGEGNAFAMSGIGQLARTYFGGFNQALFLIDACASGLVVDSARNDQSSRGGIPLPRADASLDFSALRSGLAGLAAPYQLVVTAARAENPAYENETGGHFTQSLLDLWSRDGSSGAAVVPDEVAMLAKLQQEMRDLKATEAGKVDAIAAPRLDADPAHAFIGDDVRSDTRAYFMSARSEIVGRVTEAWRRWHQPVPSTVPGDEAASTVEAASSGVGRGVASRILAQCAARDGKGDRSSSELAGQEALCSIAVEQCRIDGCDQLLGLTLSLGSIRRQLGAQLRKTDPDEAARLLRSAADDFRAAADMSDGADGGLELADMMFDADGFLRNDANDRAMAELVKKAYDAGNVQWGANFYGYLLWKGEGVAKNIPLARQYLEQADTAGNRNAAYNLGEILSRGVDAEPDIALARKYYARAAELGNLSGYTRIGQMFFDGQFGPVTAESDREALEWVNRALAENPEHAWSLSMLGWAYREGRGVGRNLQLAATHFRRAYENGETWAGIDLGWMLVNGQGIIANLPRAIDIFSQACDADVARGCVSLADLMLRGTGFERNNSTYVKAHDLLRKSERIQPSYSYQLETAAYARRYGLGVPRDWGQALELYRAAGRQGSSWGWLYAGRMLRYGNMQDATDEAQGDPEAAAGAFGEAVKLGSAAAAIDLADMILEGELPEGRTPQQRRDDALAILAPFVARNDAAVKAVEALTYDPDLPVDMERVLDLLVSAAETGSGAAMYMLGEKIEEGRVDADQFRRRGLKAPWRYFEMCTDGASSYEPCADALRRSLDPEEIPVTGTLYQPPTRQELVDAIYRHRASVFGTVGTDDSAALVVDSMELLWAAGVLHGSPDFTMPSGYGFPAGTIAGVLSRVEALDLSRSDGDLAPSGNTLNVAGVLYGLVAGKPYGDFAAAERTIAWETGRTCALSDVPSPGALVPIFPFFDTECLLGEAGLPNWPIGVAKAAADADIVRQPGPDATPVDSVKAGDTLVFLWEGAATAGWVRARSGDAVGWVAADKLGAVDEDSRKVLAATSFGFTEDGRCRFRMPDGEAFTADCR